MSVTGSFSSVGISDEITIYAGESISIAVTGTFRAQVFLEKQGDAGIGYFDLRRFDAAGSVQLTDPGTYRLNCSYYISGTVSFSMLERRVSSRQVERFDDFTGGGQAFSTTVIDGWRSRKGSDGGCVDWTVTGAVDGVVVGTIGATTASMAVSGVQLDAGLCWKANQGNLVFEARVKISAITNVSVFVGFTDQVAALEAPATLTGTTFTTNATDAVGFLFDTDATTDTIRLVGVANDVDATHQDTSLAYVADSYKIFRIEVGTTGVATFYIDGAQVGTAMPGAVTATVSLTPVVSGFNRTTSGTPTISADYVSVRGDRV